MDNHHFCPVCYSQLAHDERDKVWNLWKRVKTFFSPEQWTAILKPPKVEAQMEMQLED